MKILFFLFRDYLLFLFQCYRFIFCFLFLCPMQPFISHTNPFVCFPITLTFRWPLAKNVQESLMLALILLYRNQNHTSCSISMTHLIQFYHSIAFSTMNVLMFLQILINHLLFCGGTRAECLVLFSATSILFLSMKFLIILFTESLFHNFFFYKFIIVTKVNLI